MTDNRMTDSINIRNCANSIYFSTITHDMFCDYRLPQHGMLWVRSGLLLIETDKERVEVKAGDYVFWRRNCTSRMKKMSDGDTPFRSIAIALDSKFLKHFFSEKLQTKKLPRITQSVLSPAVPLPHNIKVESLFMSLLPYADQNIDPDNQVIVQKQQEAAECLLSIDERFFPTLFDFYETWKIDLFGFMEQHFMQDLTLSEFASYTGRSIATFKRDFAKISTLTPQKWIINQRLELSRHLLQDATTKPSDVYNEVGFKNRTHFSGLFKRKYGLSPAAYQQQTINQSNNH